MRGRCRCDAGTMAANKSMGNSKSNKKTTAPKTRANNSTTNVKGKTGKEPVAKAVRRLTGAAATSANRKQAAVAKGNKRRTATAATES